MWPRGGATGQICQAPQTLVSQITALTLKQALKPVYYINKEYKPFMGTNCSDSVTTIQVSEVHKSVMQPFCWQMPTPAWRGTSVSIKVQGQSYAIKTALGLHHTSHSANITVVNLEKCHVFRILTHNSSFGFHKLYFTSQIFLLAAAT